ncbi:hypothetical protein F4821DRAFT_242500 [Hypoxylon rubiginosum]|uniref:Uncharacterized protein n=1 Tax=Hypoxylon rubiginosum TaxID=110542 RepID=A0ACC0CW95_9PEZI|nr:hypothetical protein F4821DRAFT_242500 [Hypoxylon rubiginosum]
MTLSSASSFFIVMIISSASTLKAWMFSKQRPTRLTRWFRSFFSTPITFSLSRTSLISILVSRSTNNLKSGVSF